jgi:hypothetical protein
VDPLVKEARRKSTKEASTPVRRAAFDSRQRARHENTKPRKTKKTSKDFVLL